MQNVLSLTDRYLSFYAVVFWLLLFFSCSNVQERKVPENLIPKEKMIDIYTDMVILDALERSSPQKLNSYGVETSEHIHKKYNIDSITLAQNIEYYNFEFDTNIEIYDQVTENIDTKKNRIDSIIQLKDSLKKEEKKQKNKMLRDSIQPIKKLNIKSK